MWKMLSDDDVRYGIPNVLEQNLIMHSEFIINKLF